MPPHWQLPRQRTLAVGTVLASLGALVAGGCVFVELVPLDLVVALRPLRFSTLLKGLALVLVAGPLAAALTGGALTTRVVAGLGVLGLVTGQPGPLLAALRVGARPGRWAPLAPAAEAVSLAAWLALAGAVREPRAWLATATLAGAGLLCLVLRRHLPAPDRGSSGPWAPAPSWWPGGPGRSGPVRPSSATAEESWSAWRRGPAATRSLTLCSSCRRARPAGGSSPSGPWL